MFELFPAKVELSLKRTHVRDILEPLSKISVFLGHEPKRFLEKFILFANFRARSLIGRKGDINIK